MMLIGKNRASLNLSFLIIVFIGLLYSKALISIGMILIGLIGLIIPNYKTTLFKLKKHPLLIAWMLIFVIHLFSGFNSTDTVIWLGKLKMKLPFLLLPFALVSIPEVEQGEKRLKRIVLLFSAVLIASSIPIWLELFSSYEQVIIKYSQGKVLTTPINHIRYSILIVVLLYLNLYQWTRVKAKVFLFISIYLFALLHVLAVRSGLMCFYITALCWIVFEVRQNRNWKLLVIGSSLLVLSIASISYFLPTISKKVEYSLYDAQSYLKGAKDVDVYSDAKRIVSYKIGWQTFKEHFWFGTGIGDLQSVIEQTYIDQYPGFAPEQRIMPHNQFLRYLTAFGIFGGLLFIAIAFLPFFAVKNDLPLYLFNIIMICSFMIEGTIENKIGLSLFIMFNAMLYYFHRLKLIDD